MEKLHIGCGTVYLSWWINIDLPSPRTYLVGEREDLVDKYSTTERRYYGRHQSMGSLDSFKNGPRDDCYVADRYGDWCHIPCRSCNASEVLGRQTFEHLSSYDARRALEEVRRVLVSGGVLRLSVPDHEATMKRFLETREEIYIRHLLGPRNTPEGYHMQSYTREGLDTLVQSFGFSPGDDETNPHCYPSICMRWVRS